MQVHKQKKNARPAGGTAERAAGDCFAGDPSRNNSTAYRRKFQGEIASLLMEGAGNGLHLRELVQITSQPERVVRQLIHEERRRGAPILSNNRDGYFLPRNDQERAACVRSLRNRAKEILAAAKAIEGGDPPGD